MSSLASSFVVLLLGLSLASACKEHEPNYCPGANPDNNCAEIDAASDGPPSCTSDNQCAAPTAVCDLASHACVVCTPAEATACGGTSPVCGSDDACHACKMHTDCASDACLPDGSCGDDTNVAYVDPGGTDNTTCTKATPCTKIAKALATTRSYVKLTGTTDEQVTINNQEVTFLADPGAKLTSTSNGILLQLTGTSTVAIYDLEISGGSGPGNPGISIPTGSNSKLSLTRTKVANNAGAGISADAGTLTVMQSQITGNTGGGISISSAEFDIENSMITQNGSPTSLIGGVDIASLSGTGMHRLDFNTIAANAGASTVNSGINCGTVTMAITFSDNIVYGNSVTGGGKQLGGSPNCFATYSDIGPDTATGTGNINADPMFVNAAQGDYHISAGSLCIDAADPAATLDVDIDGDTRPQGAGRDIGADERTP